MPSWQKKCNKNAHWMAGAPETGFSIYEKKTKKSSVEF